MNLTIKEINTILEQEMRWCLENDKRYPYTSLIAKNAFVDGIAQALKLITDAEIRLITRDNKEPEQPSKSQEKLNKLIYAVGNRFPGETRFETALRYIIEAEKRTNEMGCKTILKPEE